MTDVDPTHRTFVSYIDRTREYYAAQGYAKPYEWAYYTEVPFAELPKPVSELRIGLVTTASPILDLADEDRRPAKAPWSGFTAEPPEALYTADLAWDKEATHTRDPEAFLPIAACRKLIEAGALGGLTDRYQGVPTDYSKRRTVERDAPEILERLRQDGADAALLVPL